LAYSGWLYRDVVPPLQQIATALYELLSGREYYDNLAVTAGEIGLALALGGNRFLAKAYEQYLYYLGPTPKIIFFPVMIMWFGIGPGSKIALGTLSCF